MAISNNNDAAAGNIALIKNFFKDLNAGVNLITQAFNNNLDSVDEGNLDLLERLKDQRILMSAFNGYRLNPMLTRLLNSVLEIDRSQYIEVGLEARQETLRMLADRYLEHKLNKNQNLAKEALVDLEQQTFEIIYDAQNAVKSLANRLQTQFGFVHSLEDKILENETAIETAGKLVDNLTSFTFERMMEFIDRDEHDSILYNILCQNLLPELAKCQSQLNTILVQLRDMLSTFRKQVRQTNLLKAFSQHHYKHNGYIPNNYADNKIPNELFLKTSSLEINSHPDIYNVLHHDILIDIIQNLRKQKNEIEEIATNDELIGFDNPPEIKVDTTVFEGVEDDLIIFFKKVINSNIPLSAAEFHKANNLNYKLDHWLFAVAAYYEDMPDENRMYFEYPNFKGNRQYAKEGLGDIILEDVIIGVKDILKENLE